MSEQMKKSTEDHLLDAIRHVQIACAGNEVSHLVQTFTNSPGQYAVVAMFVTCPDAVAPDVHAAVDEAVAKAFDKHGLVFDDEPGELRHN